MLYFLETILLCALIITFEALRPDMGRLPLQTDAAGEILHYVYEHCRFLDPHPQPLRVLLLLSLDLYVCLIPFFVCIF